MIINTNISSLTSTNSLFRNEQAMNKSIEKLSSGLRINRAADDAAGLAVSEKMRSQIRGLEMAKKNAQDGISLVQTAEGAMNEIHDMLQRLRELTVQGTNGIYTTADKANIQAEAEQLLTQIDEIAEKSNFNGINLLNGAGDVELQIGLNADDRITIDAVDVTAATLGVDNLDVTNTDSLELLDTAINTVSTERATLGAVQNRLEHTMNSLTNSHENLSAAESRIRDVDMAKEMATYSKYQVLMQSGMSITAQANQKTSLVTKLLG
ncbi:flagellin N-terminal helical domain-containing protein (plasmid) [Clostridium perfringens]